jgi:tRNA 2-thiouridine synthesizing protein E
MAQEAPIDKDLDADGFLTDMSGWSRSLAKELGKRNDIPPLTDDHWKVIEFVRGYYLKYRQGPPIIRIAKATGLTAEQICTLFPCGVARGAYRLAGLPRPTGCM